MKIKRLGTILLAGMLVILLVACNRTTFKHNYTYTGEGELWSAEYDQKATEKFVEDKDQPLNYESKYNYTFELKYKGDQKDLGQIRSFKYGFKRTSGETKHAMNDIQGVRLDDLRTANSGSGSFEREDSIIKVEVEWDGQKETFDLQVRK